MNTKPHAAAVRGAETHYLLGSTDRRLRNQIDKAIMDMAAVFTAEYAPIVEAAEWAERELLRLGACDNESAVGKNKCVEKLRAELARVKGKQ